MKALRENAGALTLARTARPPENPANAVPVVEPEAPQLAPAERVPTPTSGVTPVQRGTQSCKLVKTWLDGARVIEASQNQCHGKALKERTKRRMNEANAEWHMSEASYRARYSLRKEDGFTAEELSWL